MGRCTCTNFLRHLVLIFVKTQLHSHNEEAVSQVDYYFVIADEMI